MDGNQTRFKGLLWTVQKEEERTTLMCKKRKVKKREVQVETWAREIAKEGVGELNDNTYAECSKFQKYSSLDCDIKIEKKDLIFEILKESYI